MLLFVGMLLVVYGLVASFLLVVLCRRRGSINFEMTDRECKLVYGWFLLLPELYGMFVSGLYRWLDSDSVDRRVDAGPCEFCGRGESSSDLTMTCCRCGELLREDEPCGDCFDCGDCFCFDCGEELEDGICEECGE